MNTITLSNTSQTELQSMLQALQASGQIQGASIDATASTSASTSLTITTADGTVVKMTINTPDIDGATTAAYDADDMAALSANMELLADDVQAMSATPNRGALVDIYQVMALLMEVETKQRETTLQERAAAHASTAASLRGQAAEQRQAAEESYTEAKKAAITQIVTSSISFACSAVSFGLQVRSFTKSSVAQPRAEYNNAKAELAEVSKWPKSDTVANNPNNQAGLTNPPDAIKAKFDKVQVQGGGEQNTPTVQARENYIQAKTTETNAKANVEGAKGQLNDLETSLTNKKAELANAPDNQRGALQNEVDDLQGQIDTKKAQVARLETDYRSAQVDSAKAAKNYASQLDKQLADIQKNPNIDADTKKACSQYVADEKACMRDTAVGGYETVVQRKLGQYDMMLRKEDHSAIAYVAKAFDLTGQASKLVGDPVATYYNANAQYKSNVAQADAKEREAEQEEMRAQTESLNDLVQSQKDMIQFILKLLQGVNEAENQATEAAIRV